MVEAVAIILCAAVQMAGSILRSVPSSDDNFQTIFTNKHFIHFITSLCCLYYTWGFSVTIKVADNKDNINLTLKRLEIILQEKFPITSAQLVKTREDDAEKCDELGVCEHILDSCGPLDVPAVDECQSHCNEKPIKKIGALKKNSKYPER